MITIKAVHVYAVASAHLLVLGSDLLDIIRAIVASVVGG